MSNRQPLNQSGPYRLVVQWLCVGLLAAAAGDRLVQAHPPERQAPVHAPGDATVTGWQQRSYDGCHFVVPSSWHEGSDASEVSAPDGSNLSIRMFRTTMWSRHKSQIKAAFVHLNVVHEDSDRRLWFEFGNGQRSQHYISATDGLHICSGLLEVRATTPTAAAIANRIAESIGPDRGPGVQ